MTRSKSQAGGASVVRRAPALAPVTLSEDRGLRYLHFGSEWIQGAMRIARPYEIALEYTRQMMAWLLFLDPQRPDFQIGQLGLGAAALTKFCWKHCAPAQVTAVDIDPAVIACAHSMFALPPEDARLSIVEADAAHYVARVPGRFDVLQVDLYDAQARGPVHESAQFYADCAAALRPVGILVVNLFGEHASFPRNFRRLLAAFEGRVIALPEIDAGNRVALAFRGPPIDLAYADLYARAKQVEAQNGLPARRWVDGFKRAAAESGRASADGRLRL